MRRLVSSRAGIPLRVARQGEPLVAIVPSLGGQPLPLSLLTALIKILMASQGFKFRHGTRQTTEQSLSFAIDLLVEAA